MDLTAGMIVHGKITTITKFGAFVTLQGGKSGLVHISEISKGFVKDIHDLFSEGQEVDVKVISVMPDGKINLSIKQAQDTTVSVQDAQARIVPTKKTVSSASVMAAESKCEESSFEDKLKKFMTASEGKMSDLNRHMEGKRRRR